MQYYGLHFLLRLSDSFCTFCTLFVYLHIHFSVGEASIINFCHQVTKTQSKAEQRSALQLLFFVSYPEGTPLEESLRLMFSCI